MTRLIDITGQRFTRLLVKEYTEGKKWLCVGDCGTEKEFYAGNLKRGLSRSCGCLKAEMHERQKAAPKVGWTAEQAAAYNKEYRKKHGKRLRAAKRAYNLANKEAISEAKRRCYNAKKEEYKDRVKRNYALDPEIYISRERRKSSLRKHAMPSWADLDKIKELYRYSRFLTESTGIRHEVDHIIPLVSDIVCGLHWEVNMQVITMQENRRKTNKLIESY